MAPALTETPGQSNSQRGSFLTKYFLVILFTFACLSLALNSRFTHIVTNDASIIEHFLKDSVQSYVLRQNYMPIDSSHMVDDSVRGASIHKGLANPHQGRVAGLSCEGLSDEETQEMVYWEVSAVGFRFSVVAGGKSHRRNAIGCFFVQDIPSDANWISPFHPKKRNAPPQYLTFEPDQVR